MLCKRCGKENLDDSKFCTVCGNPLLEESILCKACGTKNQKEAKFCKACGHALDVKHICPSCGLENKEEARYCKACGTQLYKTQESRSIYRFVFNVISLVMCSFIILYSFSATFTPFLIASGYDSTLMGALDVANLDLFQIINNISNANTNEMVKALGVYGKVSYLLPNVISLLGICVAMAGCTGTIVMGTIRAFQNGLKKQLPKLENLIVWSIGFLLIGTLIVSLNHFSMGVSSNEGNLWLGFRYGPVVLSAVCIGIIWILISNIIELIFRLIEGCNLSEVGNRIFKEVEIGLITILVFNIVINFAKIWLEQDGVELILQTSSLDYFRYAYCIAGLVSVNKQPMSNEVIQSLVMSAVLVAFMTVYVVIIVIFFIRRGTSKKEETYKSSLACGIVLVVLSIASLVLSCVAAPMILKDTTLFDLMMGGAGEALELFNPTVSSNVIITFIFSIALLGLEIAWKIVGSKRSQPKYTVVID